MNALILNIQRYSIQDGPGIRTTIFIKGCPLGCKWCSNPESQNFQNECMDGESVAKMMDVDSVLRVAERDRAFYIRSGGGITISGGEPLSHPKFSKELAVKAQERGIHVAIETSGFQKWEVFQDIAKHVDCVLYDIKHMDDETHLRGTGVSNKVIIENFKKLTSEKKNVITRTPVIPSFNASYGDLRDIVQFSKNCGVEEVNFIPYHRYGISKYEKLGMKYELAKEKHLEPELLEIWVKKLKEEFRMNIRIV